MTKLTISTLTLTAALMASTSLLSSAVMPENEIREPTNRMTPAEISSIRLQAGDPRTTFIGQYPDGTHETDDIGAFALVFTNTPSGDIFVLISQDLYKFADEKKTQPLYRAQTGGPAKINGRYPATTLDALLQGPANLQSRGLLAYLENIGALRTTEVNYTEQGITTDANGTVKLNPWGPAKTFALEADYTELMRYLQSSEFTNAKVERCDDFQFVKIEALIASGIGRDEAPAVSTGKYQEMVTVDGKKVRGTDEAQMRKIYGTWILETVEKK